MSKPEVTPEMFLNLGITWSNLDNPEKALAAFQECADARQRLPVQQRLGLLLLDLERPQEAGEWLKKAVGQAPDKTIYGTSWASGGKGR